MEEFKAQLGKMDKEIKGLGPFRMVEETINGFQQSLPLIQNLKSDSLRERHWLKLMELTGKTFDMNPRTFTLGSLFELNLDQYEDDIMTICGGALKELNIEVGINAIADTWRLQRFDVVKYFKGPQERGLILKGTDDITTSIDENMMSPWCTSNLRISRNGSRKTRYMFDRSSGSSSKLTKMVFAATARHTGTVTPYTNV